MTSDNAERIIPAGEWDPNMESMIIKRDGPWIVSVSPMVFNDRVLLTHEDEYPYTWTSGYCYDKGAAAALAAQAWSPTTQHQPVGFKKIAAEGRRAEDLDGYPQRGTFCPTNPHHTGH